MDCSCRATSVRRDWLSGKHRGEVRLAQRRLRVQVGGVITPLLPEDDTPKDDDLAVRYLSNRAACSAACSARELGMPTSDLQGVLDRGSVLGAVLAGAAAATADATRAPTTRSRARECKCDRVAVFGARGGGDAAAGSGGGDSREATHRR